MTFRERQLLRLRELLDQLLQLQEQLAWCQDELAGDYLADCILRDLEQCRRIVLTLKSPSRALLAN
jgi:hypothetical protein